MTPSNSTPAVIDAAGSDIEQPSPLEPLRPLPVEQVSAAMAEYQTGLRAVVDDTDWQVFRGRDGEQRFLKRSGWEKIALWFGLDVSIVRETIERDEHGQPQRAKVIARAVAPNGRSAENIGACSIRERRFSKPEHDIIATAATRAINRAISNLVGLGKVSAEEVEDPPAQDQAEPPPWAQSASPERIELARAGLANFGLDDEHVNTLVQSWATAYGVVPNVLVNTITGVLRAQQHQAEQQAGPEDVAAVADAPYPPEQQAGDTPEGAAADAIAASFSENDTRTPAEKLADNDIAIRQDIKGGK